MNPLNEGNPSEHKGLAAEVQRGFDESGKLPDRLKRYAFARERALINITQIKSYIQPLDLKNYKRVHYEKISSRISVCGDYIGFKHYYTVGKVRLTGANFCKAHLLCPLCAIRRGSKFLESYLQRYEIIKTDNPLLKLSMLTMTVKNGDDLGERFKHLKKSLKKMLEWRRKTLDGKAGYHSEFSKIAGLVGSIEVTKDGGQGVNKETGWHPHAHIMVLHEQRFDYVALQDEWLKITGDSHVLNVTPAKHPNDPAQDFLEVFKYALKFADLTPLQNLQAYDVMRGKHLLFSAGLFWGVEVPESMLDVELDELPFIELFYQYIAGSGYNLAKTFDSENLESGQIRGKSITDLFRTKNKFKCSTTSSYDRFEVPADITKSLKDDLLKMGC
jgi:hypothetical protein